MSENKKVALGLGKGVLTLICVLVWYGENEGEGGHWGGARAASPHAVCSYRCPALGRLLFLALWLSEVSLLVVLL